MKTNKRSSNITHGKYWNKDTKMEKQKKGKKTMLTCVSGSFSLTSTLSMISWQTEQEFSLFSRITETICSQSVNFLQKSSGCILEISAKKSAE